MSEDHNIGNIKLLHENLGNEGLIKYYNEIKEAAFKSGKDEGIWVGFISGILFVFLIKSIFKI